MQILKRRLANPAISLILAFSFTYTVARSVTMPFMTIYLASALHTPVEKIGVVLSLAFVAGTVASLFGGVLIDRFNKARLLMICSVVIALIFAIMPALTSISVVAVALVILTATLAVTSAAIKASLSDATPPKDRVQAFSMNYTLINVAWAVGPLATVPLLSGHGGAAFYIAAALALLAMLPLSRVPTLRRADAASRPDFIKSLSSVARDRVLLLFTIGGACSAVSMSQFSAYLSQYLVTKMSAPEVRQFIGHMVTTNAVVVVCTQYLLSRFIRRETLLKCVLVSSCCVALGLIGFGSSTHLMVWVLAMAVFTLGEVVLAPAEYLYIDHIAPEDKRGSYYAMFNLGSIGNAVTPMLCGYFLLYGASTAMFSFLIGATLLGVLFYYLGDRKMRGL